MTRTDFANHEMLVDRHLRALEKSVALAALVQPEQRERSTPYVGWYVTDLLAHMTEQNLALTAALKGKISDDVLTALKSDPSARYALSAGLVSGAVLRAGFMLPDGLDTDVFFVDVDGGTMLSGRVGVQLHLVECVVHAHDLARTVDRVIDFDDDVLTEATRVVRGEAVAPAPLDRPPTVLGRHPPRTGGGS